MKRGQAQEFTEALGQVIGGAVRLTDVALDLGVPAALGLTAEEWQQRRLVGAVKLTIDERRAIVDANPEKSTRELGEALGVDQSTIVRDRDANASDTDANASLPEAVNGTPPDAALASTTFECYTPADYVEAAREALGAIDLDPASSEDANRTVRAVRYYDAAVDGLKQPWQGRVFLNPPYGRSLTSAFVAKLAAEYEAGEVTAAVALLNAYGFDAAWFEPLWQGTLCFTDHRIRFYGGSPTFGSLFVYLGDDRDRFATTFRRFGAIVEARP